MPSLTSSEARAFYDRFGARQDRQAFYEDAAFERLIRWGDFGFARRVFELGCGTGRLASRLLSEELPPDARYVGVDLSSTMVSLARQRLAPFGERVRILETDGSLRFGFAGGSFDRFVATYVLDLLPERAIAAAVREARRLLSSGGRLCLAGLTRGQGPVSLLVSSLWTIAYRLRPRWVGGCRPVEVIAFLPVDDLAVLHREVVSSWGVPSEVLVAKVDDDGEVRSSGIL